MAAPNGFLLQLENINQVYGGGEQIFTAIQNISLTLNEGEFVGEDVSLNEAVHQLVIGHHQSLLVVREKEIIGILRLTDVFSQVSDMVKACGL